MIRVVLLGALVVGVGLWWLILTDFLGYLELVAVVVVASVAWRLVDERRRARAVPRARVVWASPDCTYFSKTKGSK